MAASSAAQANSSAAISPLMASSANIPVAPMPTMGITPPPSQPMATPVAPAPRPRPLARTIKDFNKIFSQSYFDPESKDPRPTKLQRDQSSVLRSALGYEGRMTLNDLVNLPQAQIEAALAKAKASGPLKIDKGNPWRKDFTPKQRAAQLAGKKVSDKKIQNKGKKK